MFHVQEILESHPHWSAVLSIYHKLTAHGYKAFLAGGCVRDALLGLCANDLDFVTDASPDEIEALFEKTVSVGKAFGVIRVLIENTDIEVATFRTDGPYKDGRHPEGIRFSSPEEDAQRRDFTVNALFYDLDSKKILDFVHGKEDLDRKIIRTVGDPKKRFEEDHLRLLRAARFVAQLNFTLEEATFLALKEMSSQVTSVSGERLRDEMYKLLKSKAVNLGLQVMVNSGLMYSLFPFWLKNNTWPGSFAATELWQFLALFVRKAAKTELDQTIELLKLSAKEQRAIEKAWNIWQRPEEFFNMNLGKKIQKLTEEGVFWALSVFYQEKSIWEPQINILFNEWDSWQRALPRPYLNGDDVKGKLVGKDIGACLTLAFEMQLERMLTSREGALEWLRLYLEKRESNG
ncbi:MAG: CCA tRNA nucleotidyltransferase [Pseudobdellovibrionaceae bacterium]